MFGGSVNGEYRLPTSSSAASPQSRPVSQPMAGSQASPGFHSSVGSSMGSNTDDNSNGSAGTRRPNPAQAYLINLLNRIQPPPGMTRQQKLQQMIRSGELKREDIVLLQRHQQYLKHQQQQQQAMRATGQMGTAQGKTIPRNAVQGGKSLPGKSLPSGLPGKTPPLVSHSSMPAEAIRRSLSGQAMAQISQQQQQQQRQQQQQQQQQQKQQSARTFMGLTQEQLAKFTPHQKKMLMLQQLRKRARTQRFYESNAELLKKYENYPASLELHIHENHYRFGTKDTVIPKNSPTIKEFLKYVARGEIPEALMEVIRDGGIQMYDGSLILKVFDHRIVEESALKGRRESVGAHGNSNAHDSDSTAVPNAQSPNTPNTPSSPALPLKPKEYRTILRMTQMALYDDLAMQTDSQQFHDTFALTFESEVLTSLNRSVNLQPILNPYVYDSGVRPDYEMVVPQYDDTTGKIQFPHRQDAREIDEEGHSLEPITWDNLKYKPLHEDLFRSNSKYERLMTILSQSYRHSNRIAEPSNEIGDEPAHFERLRFIEMWRNKLAILKQQAALKQQPGASNTLSNVGNPVVGGGVSAATGFGGFMTQQERAMLSQRQIMNQRHKDQMAAATAAVTSASNSKPGSISGAENSETTTKGARKKTKRKPRKPTKKQLAAQAAAAAANGDPHFSVAGKTVPEEPPQKKRKTYKKRKKEIKTEA